MTCLMKIKTAILAILMALALAPGGFAAEKSESLKKRKVARTTGLSQDVYKKMQAIQTLIEEDEVDQAEAKLKNLQSTKLSE